MNGVDLNRFEFDYDTTWAAFFVDADLNIYSRYGGRDGGDPERRLHKNAFLHTMQRVLELHARRQTLKPADYQPVPPQPATPEDLPLLRQNHQGCVHCHQVQEYRLLQEFHDGKFTRKTLFRWPLPENLGIEPDFEHGHRVRAVRENSAAQAAGLQPGDVVETMNNVPIRSELDLRWALHRAAESQPLKFRILRTGGDAAEQRLDVTLKPSIGWKETDLGWRKSLRSVPFRIGMRGAPLTPSQRAEIGLSENNSLAMRALTVASRGLAANVKLQKRDVVIAIDGESKEADFDEFRSDLLRKYAPGDTVRLTVLRDGQTIQLSGPFPDWHTDETTVP